MSNPFKWLRLRLCARRFSRGYQITAGAIMFQRSKGAAIRDIAADLANHPAFMKARHSGPFNDGVRAAFNDAKKLKL